MSPHHGLSLPVGWGYLDLVDLDLILNLDLVLTAFTLMAAMNPCP